MSVTTTPIRSNAGVMAPTLTGVVGGGLERIGPVGTRTTLASASMRALDPRLLRHARTARPFLVASVGLGVATALLVVVQANLLAYAISAVFHDGATRRDLGGALAGLAVVVVAR